jgi:hypothetical protein
MEAYALKIVPVLFCAAIIFALLPAADADEPAAQPMHFTTGAVATPYAHCADLDLCAKVAYANGDVLSVYSEGAAQCQPYFLHFVMADNAGRTRYEFSRAMNHTNTKDAGCGHTVGTEIVFDHGYVHMLITENTDGTLDTAFSVAKQ